MDVKNLADELKNKAGVLNGPLFYTLKAFSS